MKFGLKQAITVLLSLSVGFLLGFAVFSSKSPVSSLIGASELHDMDEIAKYPHVSPLLFCNNTENLTNRDLLNTKEVVSSYIENKKADGTLTDAAVYFRDLNNGPWFGIDQDKQFSPGSLLKVPLLISYYKYAQDAPSILSAQIEYAGGDAGADQFEKPQQKIEIGKAYSVDVLLEYMANYSDNNAALLLYEFIDRAHLEETYKDLGLTPPDPKVDYNISVHDYASFFRVLYNSTYLNQTYSEKALGLLTHSTFRNGIVAGVPSGIEIAHKFGERTYANNPALKQLHDCGIIYAPNHPYLLCLMTRGSDFTKLEGVIKDMSDIVYRRVTQ